MIMIRTLLITAGLILAGVASAQSDLAELIEQTGVEAGDVPMQAMPGWRQPQKIVMMDVGVSREEVQALVPGAAHYGIQGKPAAIRRG